MKDWRGKSWVADPRESGPKIVQGPGGVNKSSTLLGLEPAELSEI